MLKILLLVAVLVAVYFIFFKKKGISDKNTPKDTDMVECAKCGTYVQLSDAIIKDSKYYCSKECAI